MFKTDACLPWGLIVMRFYSNEGQSWAAGRCETNSNQGGGGVRVDIVKYNKPFFILGRTMFHGEGCALMVCLAPSPYLRDIDVSGQ